MSELICYLPSQWQALKPEQLQNSVCVVIDVIRATSTIVTALANGASGVQPVAAVEDAFSLKAQDATALLAGERGGKALDGFDLGNSPEAFTAELVTGRRVILTTTNGTQALAVCQGARGVLTAGMVNVSAVAARMIELGPPWTIVCAGFNGQFGLDDAIVAGALVEAMGQDHALVSLYRSVKGNLAEALLDSWAGQELVKIGIEKDVPFCAQRDLFSVVPMLGEDGVLRG
jgi:2-phosphosulfolactate phosphatase